MFFHGSSSSALILKETLLLSTLIILALAMSSSLTISLGFSINCHASSEMCTNPSNFLSSLTLSRSCPFGPNLINAPKSTTPLTLPSIISPTWKSSSASLRSSSKIAFSETINFLASAFTSIIRTEKSFPI